MSDKKKPTKEMKAYALEEMTRLLKNMQYRPIECYTQTQGKVKQFFLGSTFIDNLIKALEEQYNS